MWEDEEYDSTWAESEEEPEPEPEGASQHQEKGAIPPVEDRREAWPGPAEKRKFLNFDKQYRWRNRRAAKDMQRYRHGYPDLGNTVRDNGNMNFKFYMNEVCCQPDECSIEDMIKWKGNYGFLERNHSYIQWLFPLREPGMNWYAKELTRQEIELFKETEGAKKRLIQAYSMMLDFYGIELVNEKTGEVKRAHHWEQQFFNLNLRTHNNLRITRILKCLGEMGFEHYQSPLVKFFLTETLVNNQLPRVRESVLDYFLYTVRSKSERRKLILYAQQHFHPLEDFVWGPPRGTEHRFSHILEELQREEVNVQETVNKQASDEDMSTENEEISYMSSEAAEGRIRKPARLMKPRSSDSMEKSINCVKDTEERSADNREAGTPDTATGPEQRSAEEKSNRDGKSPVSEIMSHQNGNIEKQPTCEEEVVMEGSKPNAEELVPGHDVLKNCESKHQEKTEDDLEMYEEQPGVVASEATSRKGTESKENLLSSIEPELVSNEEDEPATEGKIRNKATGEMDEIAKPGLVITEEDKLATVESKIGNKAMGEMDEIAEAELVITEEDKLATVGNITGNTGTGQMDEIAKPGLVITEEDKLATVESTIGNKAMGEMEEIAKPGLVITEEAKLATQGSKIGNKAMGKMDEIAKPGLVITEENNLATQGSKIGNIATETNAIAESQPFITEEDKLAKEEDKIGNMVIGEQTNVLTELEIHGGQNKSVSEREIPSSTDDGSECLAEMETQQASPASTTEDVKCPRAKSAEMEIEGVKCPVERGMEMEIEDVKSPVEKGVEMEEDVEMEDGQ